MGNQNGRNNFQNQQFEDPSLIIQPYLYLGGASINRNPHLANYYGITHVLNMASELMPHIDLFVNRNIKYKHIPADDVLNYNIKFHFEEAFELIDDARKTNGRVLVHCAMGISRSATIVIAYIMSRYNLSLKEALDFVRSKRPIVSPNALFMRLLQDYEYELNKKKEMEQRKYLIRPLNPMAINASGSFNKSSRSFAYL